jgi:4a-hydroxytetrahydrobiopterin dehydratase
MVNLTTQTCQACEGGVLPLDAAECARLLQATPGWHLRADKCALVRQFTFKNFYHTMSFVNAIAYLAEQEGHHPDMTIHYNHCTITYTTHAINGLSHNDFICAAKINTHIQPF